MNKKQKTCPKCGNKTFCLIYDEKGGYIWVCDICRYSENICPICGNETLKLTNDTERGQLWSCKNLTCHSNSIWVSKSTWKKDVSLKKSRWIEDLGWWIKDWRYYWKERLRGLGYILASLLAFLLIYRLSIKLGIYCWDWGEEARRQGWRGSGTGMPFLLAYILWGWPLWLFYELLKRRNK